MSTPSIQARKISDVEDLVATVKHLNEALFLAAGSFINTNPQACNALQAVSDEIENKLCVVTDRLEEIRGELA